MNVAVIPARGGSKRIPRKNVRDFCGRPMIAWSICAALESGCIDRVVVSTDDPEIADCSRKWGAEAPFVRPDQLADDKTGIAAVLRHAVSWFDAQSISLDYVCCIFATAPFLNGAMLYDSLQHLQSDPTRQYVFSAASFAFPIQRAVRMTPDGGIEPFHPECMAMRSQDLEQAYHEAGQFFWGHPQSIREGVSIYSPGASLPFLIPRYRVQDIDTPEDWERAELLHKALTLAEDHGRNIQS